MRPSRQLKIFNCGGLRALVTAAALIKTRLKPMQHRRGLIDGFPAKTGLDLTVP
jgi:hypothetical protein